jgi:hypothetical protein
VQPVALRDHAEAAAGNRLGLSETPQGQEQLGPHRLSYDHTLDDPAIRLWNDNRHVEP